MNKMASMDKKKKAQRIQMKNIPVVNPDLCDPSKCSLECMKVCPIERTGGHGIEVDHYSEVAIPMERACIQCGLCVKCPFGAITMTTKQVDLDIEDTPTNIHHPNMMRNPIYQTSICGVPVTREDFDQLKQEVADLRYTLSSRTLI